MKITKLQTWLVRPRWAFIEISTDAGISGWGEPVLEGRAATVCEQHHLSLLRWQSIKIILSKIRKC